MNKKLMMMGLMALLVSGVNAGACGASGASCDKATASIALTTEEAEFAAKLSPAQARAFNTMPVNQRLKVLKAHKAGAAPNAAVDTIVAKQNLAAALSEEEKAFIAQLGKPQVKAFKVMNVEQRRKVLNAHKKGKHPSANEAVDAFLAKQNLVVVNGALKTKTADVK